jgi:hypothetical protein
MNTRLSLVLKILSVAGTLCLGGTMVVYAQTGVAVGDKMAITVEVVGIDKADRTLMLLPNDKVLIRPRWLC